MIPDKNGGEALSMWGVGSPTGKKINGPSLSFSFFFYPDTSLSLSLHPFLYSPLSILCSLCVCINGP